jgi:sugar/nucleoside kinase (ribokinase family)
VSGAAAAARPSLGRVVTLGACILDVLGRPVESIPPGQGSIVLQEIRATAAGTAAGPAVDLARLGAQVSAIGPPDALGAIASADDGLPAVAAAARGGGATVVIDMLRRGSRADFERLAGLIGAADWFCPNDSQLLGLTGRPDITAAIDDVLALGTGGVAVTLAADGCLVTAGREGGLLHIPAGQVDVVDATGCGDGFDAGLIGSLLLGCEPADAARLGTACGSLVATGLGSDAGITTLDDAIAFLRRADPAAAARVTGLVAAHTCAEADSRTVPA